MRGKLFLLSKLTTIIMLTTVLCPFALSRDLAILNKSELDSSELSNVLSFEAILGKDLTTPRNKERFGYRKEKGFLDRVPDKLVTSLVKALYFEPPEGREPLEEFTRLFHPESLERYPASHPKSPLNEAFFLELAKKYARSQGGKNFAQHQGNFRFAYIRDPDGVDKIRIDRELYFSWIREKEEGREPLDLVYAVRISLTDPIPVDGYKSREDLEAAIFAELDKVEDIKNPSDSPTIRLIHWEEFDWRKNNSGEESLERFVERERLGGHSAINQ